MSPDKRKTEVTRKVEDAAFLVDNFGIATPTAADLVSDEVAEAAEVEDETRRRNKEHDPLAGAQVPREPGTAHVEDSDEVRLKPVIHRNDRYTPRGR